MGRYDNIDDVYKMSSQTRQPYRCDIVSVWKIGYEYVLFYLLLVIYYFIIFLMCIHLYIAINVQYCSVAVFLFRYYYTLWPT